MAYRSTGAGYADIAAHFRRRIEDGDLTPGQSLPPVAEISQQFRVSPRTVSRALGVLKKEGLVLARGARGTEVAGPQAVASGIDRPAAPRTGWRFRHDNDSTTGHQVLQRQSDPKICQALRLEPGTQVVLRVATLRQNGRPTVVGVSVYPPRAWEAIPELLAKAALPGCFSTTYKERTGRELVVGQRTGYLRLASRDELAALEITVPRPTPVTVFVADAVLHDGEGPVAYWEDIYAPDAKLPVADL